MRDTAEWCYRNAARPTRQLHAHISGAPDSRLGRARRSIPGKQHVVTSNMYIIIELQNSNRLQRFIFVYRETVCIKMVDIWENI